MLLSPFPAQGHHRQSEDEDARANMLHAGFPAVPLRLETAIVLQGTFLHQSLICLRQISPKVLRSPEVDEASP